MPSTCCLQNISTIRIGCSAPSIGVLGYYQYRLPEDILKIWQWNDYCYLNNELRQHATYNKYMKFGCVVFKIFEQTDM